MLTYIKFVLCVLLCDVTELYIVVSLVYSVLMFTATFKDESGAWGGYNIVPLVFAVQHCCSYSCILYS